ncbi:MULTISPECIES: SAM-dependent methyltransferase [Thermomonosporaceae]|uniref:SAM-dependent methyltransferase n=1 Tax=Thermomonosporaceae TaxID=2012 RepID=UPI00255B2910|nr:MULTISPECIES: SAM-dependent methyltransferase [Thermomonosporaceae]MDL4771899.1 SAM-dependent methyltransferase [Actinomadura xylanilytica]
MTDTDWEPTGIDVNTPSTARIYDFLLDGKDNFPADREAAAGLLAASPNAKAMAQANRRFLVRAVRVLAQEGVRQFIDLGTGIPTSPNVHEVAREVLPDARVVYVDHDPIVTAHNRALRTTVEGLASVQADVRRPEEILAHPDVAALIDFAEPVAVLALSVFHFVTERDGPARILGAFTERMAPGSHLVITSTGSEGFTAEELDQITRPYQGATSALVLRSRAEIEAMFDGLELLEPGVVDVFKWRADEPMAHGKLLAGVARKP